MAYRSISTVKADVARRWFQAEGEGIVWAVVDSGIDGAHPHFRKHANLEVPAPLQHRDFTADPGNELPLTDEFGNGTQCAGIIAGEMFSADGPMIAVEKAKDPDESKEKLLRSTLRSISGMAPKTKLVSLKVLDASGRGSVSKIIEALAHIEKINDYGRKLLIHGVNLSLGYEWDAESYACGQSPLCIAVNRLVQTGVFVVVASGNTGYGVQSSSARFTKQGLQLSINDPGNAELAMTVGSTHRDQPMMYGVSYFSAKGPTLDGRLKPDIIAPGEYIVSALSRAAALKKDVDLSSDRGDEAYYEEKSGTSMSAAHVSGIAAALLSVRRELIGKPAEVKSILMSTAADLGRHRYFQGAGLVDLLRALFPAAPAVSANAAEGAHVFPASGLSNPVLSVTALTAPGAPSLTSTPLQQASTPSDQKLLRLMISYAHKDEGLKNTLTTGLSALNRSRLVDIWQDRDILPGIEFGPEIGKQLDEADIIVLLISPEFIASDYCYLIEMKRAIERHKAGTARVIPIVVRPTDWEGTPMWGLNPLPKDGVAVKSWKNEDEAWLNVAKGIRAVVQEMTHERW